MIKLTKTHNKMLRVYKTYRFLLLTMSNLSTAFVSQFMARQFTQILKELK
jgi:hypothetical protein